MNFMISKVATSCAVFASVVFGVALTVHAADRNWIGKEEGVANTPESPYTIQNLANWDGSGDTCDDDLYLSVTEKTYIQSTQGNSDSEQLGSTFYPNSGEFVFTGPLWNSFLRAGNVANSTVSILKKSGNWTFSGDSWNRIGVGAGSYAKVVNQSGNWTFAKSLLLADSAGSTGIVENVSGDWRVGGDLRVSDVGYGEFTQYGGSLTVGGDMYIGYSSSARGVLTIKGGTVTVPSGKSVQLRNGTGTINLDGGTLVTPQIFRKDGSAATTIIGVNFNGGTLKANAASSDFIYGKNTSAKVDVGANGGVIDCGGYAVTLAVGNGAVGKGITGSGSLTFTGGNTITLNCDVSYSGATRVTPGTILAISNATAKANILGNGLVVVGAPTNGQVIVTHNAALAASDYANISCPLAPTTTYKIGDDGMSIVVDTVGSHPDNFWTGAAGDNNLSTPGNWYNGVPTGNALIYSAGPARLTKGGSFAPTSITFFDDSSPVTIDGDFTALTSVTNNSTLNQTFAGFVDFGERDIDVTAPNATLSGSKPNYMVTGGCVVFAGGAKGAKVANHSIVSGNYTLTSEFTNGDSSAFTVNENSSLSVKNADSTKSINICEGATFNVADFSLEHGATGIDNRIWNWNKGTFIVTNFTFTDSSWFCLGGNQNELVANANAVLKVGTLTIDGGGTFQLHGTGTGAGTTLKMYIGEGGLNIASGKAGYYAVRTSAHRTTMCPWNSDFTFGRGSNANYDFLLGLNATYGNINFTLNTDDEAGVPRTVMMDARIMMSKDTSTIIVAGHGTNIVTSASPLMTGTYAVTDAATVKFDGTKKFNNEAAGFANGTISLDDGTTLEYTNAGNTLALPCKALVLPESGKATLRINGDRLKNGDHILATGVNSDAADHLDVMLADSILAGRSRYEVVEKNGNLVLTVNSGLKVIIK